MNRKQLLSFINKLNVKIDKLILQGKPYAKEAEQHKRALDAYRAINA